MIRSMVLFLLIFCLSEICIAQTFDEAIKKESFKVEPSKIDLEKTHEASTLVISCVDFRLRDETEKFLREQLYLLDDYDEISLPGASLAFVEKKYPHWGQTVEEIIGLLKDLHHIKRVIFIDHMGCGAYKLIKGEEIMKTPDTEREAHRKEFKKVRKKMKQKFPHLEVHTLLMNLDGKVENVFIR